MGADARSEEARRRPRGIFARGCLLGALALAGCDDPVDPLVDVRLNDPASAGDQVDAAIALFECGYSTFGWAALGYEDVMQPVAGIAQFAHAFPAAAASGPCDHSSTSRTWFDAFMTARDLLTNASGTGVYDRMQNEWADAELPDRARLSAIASIYVAAVLDHFGEFFCEIALDAGPLLTPDDVLAEAELWVGRAFDQIAEAGGDFAIPGGISLSADWMSRALRSRIRWARGDLQGAAADAVRVPTGFTAWVTRDEGETRRNRIFHSETEFGFGAHLGVNDWWTGAANPATGQAWPTPIPFTGYLFVGIMPDGRTLEANNLPVLWAEEVRGPRGPVPLGNGAVPDGRIRHFALGVSGPGPRESPLRYESEEEDIPLVGSKETLLIRAEAEGGQVAIDLINVIRIDESLPLVTYLDGATATQDEIRYLILEERRRQFFMEAGRYWSTKIQNTDVLWFPRGEGRTPYQGYPLGGGVRLTMPTAAYELNPSLSTSDRGTGCDPVQAPIV